MNKTQAKLKGMNMFIFVTGILVTIVGVTLLFLLPEYVISIFNDTGLFTSAQITTATNKANSVRAVGFLVIIIGIIWMLFGVFGGVQK